MIYAWYRIFNTTEFLASGFVERQVTLDLEDIGEKTFLITRGNTLSLTVDDVMLAVQMNGRNPFEFADRACYLDGLGDLYYGVKVDP